MENRKQLALVFGNEIFYIFRGRLSIPKDSLIFVVGIENDDKKLHRIKQNYIEQQNIHDVSILNSINSFMKTIQICVPIDFWEY